MSLFRPITISFALDRPSIKNVESSKPIKVQSWVLWRLTSILIHVIALTLYTYTLCYSLINYHRFVSTHPDRASAEFQRREVFGKWKFLTHWNHVIQLVYFAVAVAFDLYTLALPVEVIESKSCPNKSPPISIFHALYTFFSSSINAFFHAIVVPCALVCISECLLFTNQLRPILISSLFFQFISPLLSLCMIFNLQSIRVHELSIYQSSVLSSAHHFSPSFFFCFYFGSFAENALLT